MGYSAADREFLQALGARIRELRRSRDWAQDEFAHRCGLHRTYIGAIERGERNISAINLRKIATALGCQLGELFVPAGDAP